jgi:hypothetical protein
MEVLVSNLDQNTHYFDLLISSQFAGKCWDVSAVGHGNLVANP